MHRALTLWPHPRDRALQCSIPTLTWCVTKGSPRPPTAAHAAIARLQVCSGKWSNVTNALHKKNLKLGWFGRPCSHIVQPDGKTAATLTCPSKKIEKGAPRPCEHPAGGVLPACVLATDTGSADAAVVVPRPGEPDRQQRAHFARRLARVSPHRRFDKPH